MARKSWESLSAAYRRRLQSKGITPAKYQAGVSLSEARGHARTPEHPQDVRKAPEKYPEYVQKRAYAPAKPIIREELEQRVILRKRRIWGYVHKFRTGASDRNVKINPVTKKKTPVADLEYLLTLTDNEWQDLAASKDTRWAILWYHS